MNYTVYVHTNKTNNKKYIGITSQKPQWRWNNGKGYKTQPKFYNAILKYGWDGFTHTILHTDLTKEQAATLEQFYIDQYDSIDNGYNLSIGGETHTLYTDEYLLSIASQYKDRKEFYTSNQNAYVICLNRGLIPKIGNKPIDNRTHHTYKWTYCKCCKLAMKYKTPADFYKGDYSAYRAALRNKWLSDFKWLKKQRKPKGYWDDIDNIKAVAAKCKSKMDFKKRFGVAYKMACKLGITNDLNFNN